MRQPFFVNICNQLQENDPSLDTLSLVTLPRFCLTVEEFALLTKSLSINSTIRWLEIGLDESTTSLDLSVLASNTNLHTLAIHVTSSDKALGHALNAISNMPFLKRVELKWNGDGMVGAEIQQQMFVKLARIHSVTLIGFRLDPRVSEPLLWQECTLEACDLTSTKSLEWLPLCGSHVVKLNISNSRLSPASLDSMADNSNKLRVLDLSKNDLTQSHCSSLCNLLDSSPMLLSLSLADNPMIGDNGMKLVCDTVSHRIQRLDVSNCQISNCLDTILDTFPFLEAFNLSENPVIDLLPLEDATKLKELVLQSMSSGLPNMTSLLDRWDSPQSLISLDRLDLSGNPLTSNDLEYVGACNCLTLALAGCQIDNLGFSTLLKSCRKDIWTELYLSYNHIGDDAAETLVQNFGRLQSLQRLSLDYNPMSESGVGVLLKAGLPHRLEYLNIRNSRIQQTHSFNKLKDWIAMEEELNHQLRLNRAGKSLLHSNAFSPSLVPLILAEAQMIYGNDALFDFLRSKPDLIVVRS